VSSVITVQEKHQKAKAANGCFCLATATQKTQKPRHKAWAFMLPLAREAY
jgi:hypothetical protein